MVLYGLRLNLVLSTLVLFWASKTAYTQPNLGIVPADSRPRPIGDNIIYTCTLSSPSSTPKLKWLDSKNKEVTITDDSGRVHIEKDGDEVLKLYISNIEDGDKGEYTCEADVGGDEILTASVDLQLFKEITFESAEPKQHPVINSDGLIECVVSGVPEPTISWRHKSMKISDDEHYEITERGLIIKNITKDDDGDYECRAEVLERGDYDRREITVEVHIPPKITKQLGNTTGVEAEIIEISCKASGLPDPTYDFYRENELAPIESRPGMTVDTVAGTLRFDPVERENAGEYRCKAKNDVGSEETIGTLTVHVPPTIDEFFDETGQEKQSATLRCTVNAIPPATISFQRGDQTYAVDAQDDPRIVVNKPRENVLELTISDLQPTDHDIYTCSAVNAVGENEDEAELIVHYRPRFPAQDQVVYAWANAKRNITCKVDAEPAPKFEWFHNGLQIIPVATNTTFTVHTEGKTSNLEILFNEEMHPWIFDKYECKAENDFGDEKLEFDLKRANEPNPPEKVEIVEDTPTSVVLKVYPPLDYGGMPIISYRVDYDNGPALMDVDPGEATEIQILGLSPSTSYEFRVSARNAVGLSEAEIRPHLTDSTRSPFPIQLISPKEDDEGSKNSESYTINWETPRTGGSPITKYTFYYKQMKKNDDGDLVPDGDDKTRTVKDDPARPIMSYKLDKLKPNTLYQVQVVADNEMGASDISDPISFRTAKGPSKGKVLKGGLSTPGIVGIIIALFILFLIIVDIACYFVNNCGVTKCICVSVCGEAENNPDQKLVDPEKGEGADNKTVPVEEPKMAPDNEPSPVPASTVENEAAVQPDEEIPVANLGENADTNNDDDADEADENTPLARTEAKC